MFAVCERAHGTEIQVSDETRAFHVKSLTPDLLSSLGFDDDTGRPRIPNIQNPAWEGSRQARDRNRSRRARKKNVAVAIARLLYAQPTAGANKSEAVFAPA
jgi:hypothetical protein